MEQVGGKDKKGRQKNAAPNADETRQKSHYQTEAENQDKQGRLSE